MRWYWKTAIALGFVGTVSMAAAAFGQSGSSSPVPSASAPSQQQRAGARLGRLGSRIVHGDLKVQTPNGFANATIDDGTVTAVDHAAHTLTLKRADGQTVSVTATDRTRVRKNGRKAAFADIATGDFVQVIQIDRDGGFVVALIRDRGTGATSGAGQASLQDFGAGAL
jgi:hypothetical protein